MGYKRSDTYFDRGDIRVRGEVLDIFLAYNEEEAIRVEFFGDEVEKIYAIPGNPGISEIGECVNIQVSDIKKIVEFAKDKGIDLTVVGPEAPLVAGIKDAFEEAGLNLFGPDKSSAKLEGSKSFA